MSTISTSRPAAARTRGIAALRASGLLPAQTTRTPILTKALGLPSPASGPVVARITPGRLADSFADGVATSAYAVGGTVLDSFNVGDLALFDLAESEAYLLLEFWGLAPGDYVASVQLAVGIDELDVVEITATGNPLTLAVSHDQVGSGLVTIHVPMTAGGNGGFLALDPTGPDPGLTFFGVELRRF